MNIRWTIGRKLIALGVIAAILMIILALSSLQLIGSLGDSVQEMNRSETAVQSHMTGDMMHDALRGDVLAAVLSATNHRSAMNRAARAAPDLPDDQAAAAMPASPPERSSIEADVADHAATFRAEVQANLKRVDEPRVLAALKKVTPVLEDYIAAAEHMVELAYSDLDAVDQEMDEFNEKFGFLEDEMESVSDVMAEVAQGRTELVADSIATGYIVMFVILVSSLVVMGIAATVISRGIVKPINQALELTHAIADGHLDQSVDIDGNDEMADMLHSLQDMCLKLSEIVAQVRDAAVVVSSSSQEVASGSMDLSQRIEQMAASIEETTSTMQEIAGTVTGNADLARKAGSLAADASQRTNASMEVVGRTSGAMDEAERASGSIEEIIGTIDGIAFQTNLLALNAAVEAARAGEQGRGFAVVAQEVRSLAQRCAEAAGEVKLLVADNVEKVRQGSTLAQQSGDRLHDTADAIKELTGLVQDVAHTSSDQANGIDQINRAVAQMDSVTQQNAALVEELASASSTMDGKAQELMESVNFFKLSGDARSPSRAQRRPPQLQRLPSA